ncbi:mucin-5B-like [Myotis daubentonii]|uniref:mucin-5B-like n=1 Tax=Myotis daubentonii TaxID=98922 RepID=UPI002873C30C|nr:mucin-5B-like [Myotis daubentonii]
MGDLSGCRALAWALLALLWVPKAEPQGSAEPSWADTEAAKGSRRMDTAQRTIFLPPITVLPTMSPGPPPRSPSALNPAHNGRVCSTWGDFHYKTFDGDVFRFPGRCNYVFSAHCGAAYEDFNVQLRRGLAGSRPTITHVVLKAQGLVLEVSNGSVLIDGRREELPFSRAGLLVERSSDYVKVSVRLVLTFMWNGEDSALLELDPKYANQTCGLCGDFNGLPAVNEFYAHNARLTPLQFGNLQKLDGPTEQCQDPQPGPAGNCTDAEDLCRRTLLGPAFAQCNGLVAADKYVAACAQDLCRCPTCPCATFAEYSRQCAHAGGQPQNWRGPDLCPRTCPLNMQHQECGSPCADTCSNPERAQLCEDHCVDGCFCPPGTVLDDVTHTGCLPLQRCPCTHGGRTYAPGASFTTSCSSCTCLGGLWQCQDLPCPGTCSVQGGSHISTYDEKLYDMHGDCSYVLSKKCADSGFTVLAELRKCGLTDNENCLKTVTLSMDGGDTVIQIQASGGVFMNSIYTQLPVSAANITIFRPSTFFILVQTGLGLQLEVQLVPLMQLVLRLDPAYRGQMCGLCGNFNQNQADDFLSLSGVVEGTAAAFANTWKTQAACPNVRNSLEDPCALSVENENYARHWCSLLTDPAGAFSPCHSVISPTPFHSNCLFDTCNCEKSEDCLCAALSAYVRACAARGVLLRGWRAGVCTKYTSTCPKSQRYADVVDRCQPTCRALGQADVTCGVAFVPVDGCTCPDGTFLDDAGSCVPAEACPCYFRGSVVAPGEVVHDHGVVCSCASGKLSCLGAVEQTSTGCAAPMVYLDCSNASAGTPGAECLRSCHTLDVDCFSTHCVSGCVCPPGLVSDGSGGCVAEEDCPCLHNDAAYRPGDSIRVDCNTCTCRNRRWECSSRPCLGTCVAYGDGHFITFDGERYNFEGSCEYTLAQDYCGGNGANGTFRIVTENIPCGTTGVACSKAIKLFLENYELILHEGTYKVVQRGPGADLPYRIRYMGTHLAIETRSGLVVSWDRRTSVFIRLHQDHKGRVCGLCGNFDDNAVNDFTTRSQSVVGDALEFGNSWKLSPTCPDAPAPRDPCTANPYRKSWAQRQCSLINSATFQACRAQVDSTKYYEACVSDACACDSGGDCECFCTAVAAYAQACRDAGVCVAWRTPEVCPLFCDYYNPHGECEWHYQPCGAPCLRTCRNPSGRCLMDLPGQEGCYPKCPPSKPFFSEDQMRCVAQCGCYDDDENYYDVGTKVPTAENCQSCNCTPGGIQCTYSLAACTCTYEGRTYGYEDVIYNTTDGLGACLVAVCGSNGTITRTTVECRVTPSTTPFTFTSTAAPPSTTGPVPTLSTVCVQELCHWSAWYDSGRPEPGMGGGDFETFANLRQRGHQVCPAPAGVECRAQLLPDTPLEQLGQKVECSPRLGLRCLNSEQDPPLCHNYELRVLCCDYVPCGTSQKPTLLPRPTSPVQATTALTSPTTQTRVTSSSEVPGTTCQPRCQWTEWFDEDYPKSEEAGGDIESYDRIRSAGGDVCERPQDIECRAVNFPDRRPEELGQLVHCDPSFGLVCRNDEQMGLFKMCYNYQIRLLCCSHSHCGEPTPATASAATATSTSIATPATASATIATATTTSTATTSATTVIATVSSTTTSTTAATSTSTATPATTSTATPAPTTTATATTTSTATATTTTATATTISTATTEATSSQGTTGCEPKCEWTEWFDVDFPTSGVTGGDMETYDNIRAAGGKMCREPQKIECRAESYPEVSLDQIGQVVSCSLQAGLVCRNRDQRGPFTMCFNYNVRVLCCDGASRCPTSTAPPPVPSTRGLTTTAGPASSSAPHTATLATSPIQTTPESSATSPSLGTTLPSSSWKPSSVSPMPTSPTSGPCTPQCTWTDWFDVDYPSLGPNGGDFETYTNIREAGGLICERPLDLECRASSLPDVPLRQLGQVVRCRLEEGLVCRNRDQDSWFKVCLNYQVRVLCCDDYRHCPSTSATTTVTLPGSSLRPLSPTASSPTTPHTARTTATTSCQPTCRWTDWLDTDRPLPGRYGGDIETYYHIRQAGGQLCAEPDAIQCEAVLSPGVPLEALGQVVQCAREYGFICRNSRQRAGESCLNYHIRVRCCDDYSHCYSTPGTTAVPSPSSGGTLKPVTPTTRATTLVGHSTASRGTSPASEPTTTPWETLSGRTSTVISTTRANSSPGASTRPSPSPPIPVTTSSLPGTTPGPSTAVPTATGSTIKAPTSAITTSSTTTSVATPTACQPRCAWTDWLDQSYPMPGASGGDFETYANMQAAGRPVCARPVGLECRAERLPDVPLEQLGQVVQCQLEEGLVCHNRDQGGRFKMCFNYQIRVLCCDDYSHCPSTAMPTSTATPSSKGQRTSRPTEVSTTATTLSPPSSPRITESVPATQTARTSLRTTQWRSVPSPSASTGTLTTTAKPASPSAPHVATSPIQTTPGTPSSRPALGTTLLTSSLRPTPTSTTSTTSGACTPRCTWTDWLDEDYPTPVPDGGDFETLSVLRAAGHSFCEQPQDIECRAEKVPDASLEDVGQVVQCDVRFGLVCRNRDQGGRFRMCLNYHVRLLCCDYSHCPSTPGTTAVPSPSSGGTLTPVTPTTRATSSPGASTRPSPSPPIPVTTSSLPGTTPGPSTAVPTATGSTIKAPTSAITTSSTTTSVATPTACQPRCAWTDWLDQSYPMPGASGGDFETYANMQAAGRPVCARPEGLECRAERLPDVPLEQLGQVVQCQLEEGLVCHNRDQGGRFKMCFNYQIRVLCCDDYSHCPSTAMPTSTATPSSKGQRTSGPTEVSTTATTLSPPSSPRITESVPATQTARTSLRTTQWRSVPSPSASTGTLTTTAKPASPSAPHVATSPIQTTPGTPSSRPALGTTLLTSSLRPTPTSTTSTTSGACTPRCTWTDWLDEDYPTPVPDGGDFETLSVLRAAGHSFCEQPQDIECRAEKVPDASLEDVGQVVQCDVRFGLVCRNRDQGGRFRMCLNYHVRLLCCDYSHCPSTPGTTAVPSPSSGGTLTPVTPTTRATSSPGASTRPSPSPPIPVTTSSLPGTTPGPSTAVPTATGSTIKAPTSAITTSSTTTSVATPTACQPRCAWTDWLDQSYPMPGASGGDFETYANMQAAGRPVCARPEGLECRAERLPDVPLEQLGQVVQCQLEEGLVCHNRDQGGRFKMCFNYQIRVLCCDDYSHCPSTAMPTSTATPSSKGQRTSGPTEVSTTATTLSPPSSPRITESVPATQTARTSLGTTQLRSVPSPSASTGTLTTTAKPASPSAPHVATSPIQTTPGTPSSRPALGTTLLTSSLRPTPTSTTSTTSGACTPRCTWTDWLDEDYPTPVPDGGDFETLSVLRAAGHSFCEQPQDIECRAEKVPDASLEDVGQVVQCDVRFGLVCRNRDQGGRFRMCLNYHVRLLCCDYSHCPSTPGTTAVPSPSSGGTLTPVTPTTRATSSPGASTRPSPSPPIPVTTSSLPGTTPGPPTAVPTATGSTIKAPTSAITTSSTTTSVATPTACQPRCAWTDWLDQSYPMPGASGGDFETYANMQAAGRPVCARPVGLECRAERLPDVPLEQLGQVVQCQLEEGLVCHNRDQGGRFKMCFNYQIRVLCCDDYSHCPSTAMPTSTATPTSTAMPTSTGQRTAGPTEVSTTATTLSPASSPRITESVPATQTARTSLRTTQLRSVPSPSASTGTLTTTAKPASPSAPHVATSPIQTTPGTPFSSPISGTSLTTSSLKPTMTTMTSTTSITSMTSVTCTPRCMWTDWFDADYPTPGHDGGDFETLSVLRAAGHSFCEQPQDIECRAEKVPDASLEDVGQVVQCDVRFGLVCRNRDQGGRFRMCLNYHVRLLCCDYSHCPSTPGTTAVPSPSSGGTLTPVTPTTRATSSPGASTRPSPSPPIPVTTSSLPGTTPGPSTAVPTATGSTIKAPTSAITTSSTTTSVATPTACQPRCAWTDWLDQSYPMPGATGGDFETYANMQAAGRPVCAQPEGLECRAERLPDVPLEQLGQVVQCQLEEGLVCHNRDQGGRFKMCFNYQIRVLCCDDYSHCPSTAMPTGMATPTSTVMPTSTGQRTSRPTEVSTTATTLSPPSSPRITESVPATQTARTSLRTTQWRSVPSPSASTGTLTTTAKPASPSAPHVATSPIQTTPGTPSSSPIFGTTLPTSSLRPTPTSTTSMTSTTSGACTPRCTWTDWLDEDYPTPVPDGGDFETLSVLRAAGHSFCEQPQDIECRAEKVPDASLEDVGQVVQCDVRFGLVCRNRDQGGRFRMCLNYHVRLLCCDSHCPSSAPETATPPWLPSTPVSSASPSPPVSTAPCRCRAFGQLFSPGDVVYNRTDKAGCHFYAICNQHCELDRFQGACPTSSPQELLTATWVPLTFPTPGCDLVDPPRQVNETWTLEDCTVARCEGDNRIVLLEPQPVAQVSCVNGHLPVKVQSPQEPCQFHYECECSCSSWGDSHYVTFDGTPYSFRDNCTHVLMREIRPRHGNLSVLLDNHHCRAAASASCPRALSVRYESSEVVLTTETAASGQEEGLILFDHVRVSQGFSKNGVSVSMTASTTMRVDIPAVGVSITFDGQVFQVQLSYSHFSHNTEGQCGTCTNSKTDDCRLPDGTIAPTCQDMGSAWLVPETNKEGCWAPTGPPATTSPPSPAPTTPTSTPCPPAPLCELMLSHLFAECHDLIPPGLFFSACVQDACQAGHPGVPCQSLEAYAALCRARGACSDWRNATGGLCELPCPPEKVYKPCGPVQPASCDFRTQSPESTGLAEGCFCPDGQTLFNSHTDVCVPECPCVGPDGFPKFPGERWVSNCQACVCDAGSVSVQCVPVQCDARELPRECGRTGFVAVTRPLADNPCCQETLCVCNTTSCPQSTPACGPGEELAPIQEEGGCCTTFSCRPKLCTYNGTVYGVGATFPAATPCHTCTCLSEDTQGPTVQCAEDICDTTCPLGFEYVTVAGQCCGECVQKACLTPDGGLVQPNETWINSLVDNCTEYHCQAEHGVPVLILRPTPCPDVSSCMGILRKTGCCYVCEEVDSCQVRLNRTVLEHQGCQAPVNLTFCEGSCPGVSKYSPEAQAMQRRCSCCQEIRAHEEAVTLQCPDGTAVRHTYTHIDECRCDLACAPSPAAPEPGQGFAV